MKKYIIYFEIFGKKMKTTISAKNEKDAKEFIKDKIIFHKISDEPIKTIDMGFDDMIDKMKDIFGIK